MDMVTDAAGAPTATPEAPSAAAAPPAAAEVGSLLLFPAVGSLAASRPLRRFHSARVPLQASRSILCLVNSSCRTYLLQESVAAAPMEAEGSGCSNHSSSSQAASEQYEVRARAPAAT
jgi:hypothetical protein